jgi:hypothetical protein
MAMEFLKETAYTELNGLYARPAHEARRTRRDMRQES